MLMAIVDHHWQGLTQVMGRPELYQDPRFRSAARRALNKEELIPIIESWLQSLPDRDAALAALEGAHVPVAPVLTIPEVVSQPHFLERGTVRTVSDRVLGNLTLPGLPFHFLSQRESSPRPAPDLGEHNGVVLGRYLQYDADRVARLTAAGVLAYRQSGV